MQLRKPTISYLQIRSSKAFNINSQKTISTEVRRHKEEVVYIIVSFVNFGILYEQKKMTTLCHEKFED